MKGNNELHLNTATMIQILQQWIDSQIPLEPPTVTNVKSEKGTSETFIINLSGEARRPEPKKEPEASGELRSLAPLFTHLMAKSEQP